MTEHQAMAATPHVELLAELMNPNIPKNDREHAAVREIERLREAFPTCGYTSPELYQFADADDEPEQEPVAWLITDENINSLQVASIQRVIDRLKHAHHTDLCLRINGQDERFEADWIKHLQRATSPPQRQPLTEEQARNLLRIGPVYAPDGVVTRTPLAYRKELLETALWAFKKAEAAHGIGAKP